MKLLTLGTFDVPHMGHAAFLRRCERFGDEVVVGVNSDRFATRYRGTAPAFNQAERCLAVSRLGYRVLTNDGPGSDLIREERPQVLAIGSDWLRRDYLAQIAMTADGLDQLGIALVYVPYSAGISSTLIRERVGA